MNEDEQMSTKKQNCLQMSSKKLHPLSNRSSRSSMKSLNEHKYNLVSRESLTSGVDEGQRILTKEQIEQELLRAFDTQMSFGQKQLPKGLSSRCKQKVRSVSVNSASLRRPQPLKQSLHLNQPPTTSIKPSRLPSSHPTNRSTRSHSSHLSLSKPFHHHNKRQSITSQYLAKKQTQNLVQKLITVKPSQQVSRQKHLQSYSKHLHSKHIMMHRYDNNLKKGVILVKKTNCCSQHSTLVLKDINAKKNEQLREKKFNAIEMKEIQLRKMLKQEKRKNRLQTLKKLPVNNFSIPGRKNHQRVKTLDAKLLIKRLPVTSASSEKSSLLPKIRTFSKAGSYQERASFATPGSYSSNNTKASGLMKQRFKTVI